MTNTTKPGERWTHLSLTLEVTRASKAARALAQAAAIVGLNGAARRLTHLSIRLMRLVAA